MTIAFQDIIVDGVRIAETDFSRFTRLCQLTAWKKRSRAAATEVIGDWETNRDQLWAFGDYRDEISEDTRVRLIDDMDTRKLDSPPRNLDMKVVKTYPPEWTEADIAASEDRFNIGQNDGRSPSEIVLSDFTEARQMSNYEFAAFTVLGDDELDRQGIDTLYDMFGTEFATRFYKRKNQLIAQSDLVGLYEERDKLNERIAALEEMATAPPPRSSLHETNHAMTDALKTALEALAEARRQIEYLHGKFGETGSGNAVLARIAAAFDAIAPSAQGEAPHEVG